MRRDASTDSVSRASARLAQEPIRAEFFWAARLEDHAESLATQDRVAAGSSRDIDLLRRLSETGRHLKSAYTDVVAAVEAKQDITPAEEWFLDNYHVVDKQIREVRAHLPKGYYRRLPKIAEGHLAGFPRVYGIVWAYVAHTDSRVELETLAGFVRAYQRVEPLMLGELWAIAIHLRYALAENLRRLAEDVIANRQARSEADQLADLVLARDAKSIAAGDAMLKRLGATELADAFLVQFVQRLRDRDSAITPALGWLERKMDAQQKVSATIVAKEHQAQAAANATVRNIISSMRSINSIDWFSFVESVSPVDEILGSSYPFEALDFATRDAYRHQVEQLARKSQMSEVEVARAAVALAAAALADDPGTGDMLMHGLPRCAEGDPGWYLLGRGRRILEEEIGHRRDLGLSASRLYRRHAIGGYLAGITLLTLLQVSALVFLSRNAGASPVWLAVLAALAMIPATEVAIALVHRAVAALSPPRRIPKLEMADGIPASVRTLVVVPTLLTSVQDVEEQLERLEVHFLANPKGHLHFALLSDVTDAQEETQPGDDAIWRALVDGISALNYSHPAPDVGAPRFLVLHRRRLHNPSENVWMGWERKRGKLHELNRLLRGDTSTTFLPTDGQAPVVPDAVRYVVTLDADTRLPKDAAARLVGAMTHPMNRPIHDDERGRVVDGHAILQPRISPSLPTGPDSTTYQRISSGGGGVDPYSSAISDVYQDLLDEGSYTGKGIYDVDAFEESLKGKVGENQLLSHDLFEGTFARSGLVTDIELFEDYPTDHGVDARRRHRWVRGDWQLLPWILGMAKDASGSRAAYRLPAAGRWKMIDNLRRSLVSPTLFLLTFVAVAAPGTSARWWLTLVLATVAVPPLIPVVESLRPRREGVSARSRAHAVADDVVTAAIQIGLRLATIAYEAQLMVD
ncbi:MAG: cyclic beta-1,2-glucan synthetase, partial [Glaciecola sp.]